MTAMTAISKLNVLTGITGALFVAVVLSCHPASAQAADAPMQVAFAYHPDAPAERIYAHLQATARDACSDHGSRSLRLARQEAACARDLLARAVTQIGRADLAALHDAGGAAKSAAPLAIAAR